MIASFFYIFGVPANAVGASWFRYAQAFGPAKPPSSA